MARKSNHQRHVAKLRREKSVVKKFSQQLLQRLQRAETLLVFALQQSGGSITVSKGVGQTVMQNLSRLGYNAVPPGPGREDLDYVTITVTEQQTEQTEPAEKPKPSFTMRTIPAEEDVLEINPETGEEETNPEGSEVETPQEVVAGQGEESPVD